MSLSWFDLLERRYGCSAPRCLDFADCLLDGEPFCLDCAELVVGRMALEPAFRRRMAVAAPLFDPVPDAPSGWVERWAGSTPPARLT